MKKQFRALSLCLTLALCVFGSTAALAEGAVALLRIYARAEDRGDASINSSGHSFLSVRNVSDHDTLSAGQPYTPENLRNDILAKYGDLAAYNPQVPYDYIVYYGTSLTPSKEFA